MSRESLDQKPLPPPSKPRPETSILQPPSTLTNQDEGDVKSQSHLVTVKPLTVDTSTSLAQQNTSTTKKPTLIKSSSTSTNNGGAPAKILNNSIASPIFQSTPLQSSTNVSGATNLPVRNQSVSFSDIDIQENQEGSPYLLSLLQLVFCKITIATHNNKDNQVQTYHQDNHQLIENALGLQTILLQKSFQYQHQ